MNKVIKIIGLVLAIMAMPVAALPTLQLDIVGGTYDSSDQTIVTGSDSFDLVAYGVAEGNKAVTSTEDFYISIALTPKTGPTAPTNIGSFMFAGGTYDIGDMVYGTPPVDSVDTNPDSELGSHSIFETFYLELVFNFSGTTRDLVNTQDDTGTDPTDITNAGTALFYQLFSVDVSNLLPEYELHFDLYNTVVSRRNSADIGPDDFAPFSHDAATRITVPEPAPLVLLSLGLITLFVSRSKLQTKRVNKNLG
jgi:hypothetical protein